MARRPSRPSWSGLAPSPNLSDLRPPEKGAEELADAINGHSSGDVSARYGSGYPVELLAEAVEKAAGWLGMRRG